MFVVDTNILVYASDRDSPFFDRARVQVEEWCSRAGAWYLTWGIVYEFLRVVTHPRILRHPWEAGKSWNFIEALRAAPSLGFLVPTDRHATAAAEVIAQTPHLGGNILLDAQTAVLMKEHGIRRIYTRDTDFHRFPFLEVVDPTERGSG
jgi:toxin-antitoxin system PIN domain toxin